METVAGIFASRNDAERAVAATSNYWDTQRPDCFSDSGHAR